MLTQPAWAALQPLAPEHSSISAQPLYAKFAPFCEHHAAGPAPVELYPAAQVDDTPRPDTVVALAVATATPPGVPDPETHVFSAQPEIEKFCALVALCAS